MNSEPAHISFSYRVPSSNLPCSYLSSPKTFPAFQTVLQEILGKFDVIDQRLAVIKKYAKYGSNARGESTPTNPTKAEESEGKLNIIY